MENIKSVLTKYITVITNENGYDFVCQADENGKLFGHIVFRDIEGTIIATLLSVEINQTQENCEIICNHPKGEWFNKKVRLDDGGCLVEILQEIDSFLKINRHQNS